MPNESVTPQLRLLVDYNPNLYEMIRAAVLQASHDTTGRDDLQISDHPEPQDFVYGSHQCSIAIAAKDLLLRVKAHFNRGDTRLAPRRKRQADAREIRSQTEELTASFDLFNELINHVGGDLKRKLYAEGMHASLSLPSATSGFSELLESDKVRMDQHHAYWLLQGKDFRFVCTVSLQLMSDTLLKAYVYDPAIGGEAGSIEILEGM